MRLEALHGSTASNVEEDAAAVLVAGHQKTPRWIDAERRYRASDLQRDQMLIRHAILIPSLPSFRVRPIKVRSLDEKVERCELERGEERNVTFV